ncbi:MAG: hypothetical protein M1832_006274 [Thelocarpon impressellum]|nr:MAG: hypothetical protein M1832_006274 [Thelocarpon impressellum]
MTDTGRKGAGQQLQEKVTPDSQKSAVDKLSENVSGTVDKGLGAVQPESEKSTTQKLSDSTRSNADSAQNQGKTWTQSAQETASGVAQKASDTLNQAADYIKGTAGNTGAGSTK